MRIVLLMVMSVLVGCGTEPYPPLEAPIVHAQEPDGDPKTPQDAVAVLLHDKDLVFGERCGRAGTPTRGKIAREILVSNSRVQELERVLRDGTSSGKLHAAIGLMELSEKNGLVLSPETEKAIRRVSTSTDELEQCSGCIASTTTMANAYKDYVYFKTSAAVAKKKATQSARK